MLSTDCDLTDRETGLAPDDCDLTDVGVPTPGNDLTLAGVPTPGYDLTLAGVLAAESGPAEPGVVGVDSLAVEDSWSTVLFRLALSLPALLAITSRISHTLENLLKVIYSLLINTHTHAHTVYVHTHKTTHTYQHMHTHTHTHPVI